MLKNFIKRKLLKKETIVLNRVELSKVLSVPVAVSISLTKNITPDKLLLETTQKFILKNLDSYIKDMLDDYGNIDGLMNDFSNKSKRTTDI